MIKNYLSLPESPTLEGFALVWPVFLERDYWHTKLTCVTKGAERSRRHPEGGDEGKEGHESHEGKEGHESHEDKERHESHESHEGKEGMKATKC